MFTIGHSTRSTEGLLSLLRAHAIRTLVDVRRFPGSKRHPQFSQRELARMLAASGIEYVHEEALGGRRAVRPDSPNAAWRNRAFRGYADHMMTAEFREALDRLVERGSAAPTTVMCAEAVPWRCHRNLIADALVVRGLDVRHILSEDRADAHTLSAHARVSPDGTLAYPSAGVSLDEPQLGLLD